MEQAEITARTKSGPSEAEINAAIGGLPVLRHRCNDAVRFVAERVIAAMKGFDVGDPRKLKTLEAIARLTHCQIDYSYLCQSSYSACFDENIAGVMKIDQLCPKTEVFEQVAHELTHHILNYWEPLLTWAENEALNILGTRAQVEEMVCREVAWMLANG